MIYEATVTGVNSWTVTRKRDGKTITIYEVQDSAGKNPATSRRDLANEANRLLGQLATITIRVEQNGSYENIFLEDIRASTGAPLPPEQPQPQPQPQTQVPEPQIIAEGSGTARDWSIWRQTATKVAANLNPETPREFWQNVNMLITYYSAGLQPELANTNERPVTSYGPAQQAQASQQQQQNEFIPQGAGQGATDDYPYSDDDIPF